MSLQQVRQKHLRRRAGRRDAGDAPFQILDPRHLALRRRHEHEAGKANHVDERDERSPFGRHLDRVIVESRHDVRAAANERLQRLRSTGMILQLDVEPFLFIKPELLGERRRQIDHLVLTADRQANMGRVARRADAGPARRQGQKGHEGQTETSHV